MLEGVKDRTTLLVVILLMRDIEMKILKGERLTEDEEKILKHNLLGIDPRREFRDEKQRDSLFAKWWEEAKILHKRLNEEEEKAKAKPKK